MILGDLQLYTQLDVNFVLRRDVLKITCIFKFKLLLYNILQITGSLELDVSYYIYILVYIFNIYI